jgi:hypothetical protein
LDEFLLPKKNTFNHTYRITYRKHGLSTDEAKVIQSKKLRQKKIKKYVYKYSCKALRTESSVSFLSLGLKFRAKQSTDSTSLSEKQEIAASGLSSTTV